MLLRYCQIFVSRFRFQFSAPICSERFPRKHATLNRSTTSLQDSTCSRATILLVSPLNYLRIILRGSSYLLSEITTSNHQFSYPVFMACFAAHPSSRRCGLAFRNWIFSCPQIEGKHHRILLDILKPSDSNHRLLCCFL